jgi:hypothetical protein
VCSQSSRFPELVRELYEHGPGQVVARVAEFLDRAMERGSLRCVDPVFAAELLLAMVLGQDRTKCLFGIEFKPVDETSRLDCIVGGFLSILTEVSHPADHHRNRVVSA